MFHDPTTALATFASRKWSSDVDSEPKTMMHAMAISMEGTKMEHVSMAVGGKIKSKEGLIVRFDAIQGEFLVQWSDAKCLIFENVFKLCKAACTQSISIAFKPCAPDDPLWTAEAKASRDGLGNGKRRAYLTAVGMLDYEPPEFEMVDVVPKKKRVRVEEDNDDNEKLRLSCPISREIFSDPVVANDGHTYSRAKIERWIKEMRDRGLPITSPMTGASMLSTDLVPNHAMASLVAAYKQRNP